MTANIDPAEVAKFDDMAAHWWDLQGECKPLHEMNPVRLDYIKSHADLIGKKVLDIGCGGGILTESLAKEGAEVTGIDMSEAAIRVAKLHSKMSQLNIDYQIQTAERMAELHPEQYDVVTCLEMLEHVPDPYSIILSAAKLTKPGGHLFFSTINRNMKSYLFAIVGAEYLLKLLPKNTHDFAKFIRPSEFADWARQAKLNLLEITGMSYNPFSRLFSLTSDLNVNYLIFLAK